MTDRRSTTKINPKKQLLPQNLVGMAKWLISLLLDTEEHGKALMNSIMEKFHRTVASLPDREHLVSEIIYDGIQWAEISQEEGELVVQSYAHPQQRY